MHHIITHKRIRLLCVTNQPKNFLVKESSPLGPHVTSHEPTPDAFATKHRTQMNGMAEAAIGLADSRQPAFQDGCKPGGEMRRLLGL